MLAIFVGGKLDGMLMPIETVERFYGNGEHTEDLTEVRMRGGCCHRKELDNQPLVDGYLSPMYDGGMLRYETQEVYDMMFD